VAVGAAVVTFVVAVNLAPLLTEMYATFVGFATFMGPVSRLFEGNVARENKEEKGVNVQKDGKGAGE
jgi:hypothetical protein